mmetsp:Transcript_134360/g.347996  ORF Transcript_134360/g.347996 Transcript_134360/m.347996 type:complete len:962 (+) Transcript_134360:29-2914(+)
MSALALRTGPNAASETGCYTPESYSRFRKLAAPNLKNASIDKLDGCNEVTIGLFAVLGMTLAIWAVAIPIFDIMGMPWMRSWEGSGMTMDRFKTSLTDADLMSEALSVSLKAENLHYDELRENATATTAFEQEVKQRMALEAGSGTAAQDVSLVVSGVTGGNFTTTDCTIRAPKDVDVADLRTTLTAAMPQLGNHLEMDLAGSVPIMDLAHGPVIITNSSDVATKLDGRAAFVHFDKNSDGFVDFDEFSNGTSSLTPAMNIEETRHAFSGLDENQDNTLEYLEFDAALNQDHFFHYNHSSFTTPVPGAGAPTTTTLTSTRTATSTVTTSTAQSPDDAAAAGGGGGGSGDASGAAADANKTRTSTSTGAPEPTTTTTLATKDAAVEMLISAIQWADLTQTQREGIALAYRRDLAYAAGILKSQVMDAGGKSGCVSMRETDGGHLLVHGCLPIPEGATEADIEAVVTSGTETQKIVKDFLAVDGDAEVGTHDVKVTVTAEVSCLANPASKTTMDTADSFCEDDTEATTTPEATTTTAETTNPTTTIGEQPSELPTMKEFLERMGASDSDRPKDAFNALDANSNEFVDWEEFETSTEHFTPPLSKKEAENMFDWLDRNHDSRIESLEFLQAYELSATTHEHTADGPGPISLSEYRQSLGHSMQYTKVGVGLCRTAEQAWPQSSEHPTATTKADCQALCDGSSACGAYAFKVGGTCRIYPSGKTYPDTTPMTDVECFAKAISNKPLFDLVRVSMHLFGDVEGELSEDQLAAAEVKLAESLAFEVGEPTSALRSASGEPGKCTMIEAKDSDDDDEEGGDGEDDEDEEASGPEEENTKELKAVCFITLPVDRTIEDLTAVVKTEATRKKIAEELSALDGLPHLTADSVHAFVEGTSANFRMTDTDHSGAVSLDELIKAAATFDPAIHEEAAEYAFKGLDWTGDGQLSPDEFEAHGITNFFETPADTQ